jgi:predicted transposase YbfD/YdcC
MENPLVYFRQYKDHRMDRRKEHKLEDIIAITLSAVICGAESWYEVAEFGKRKQEWLSTFLELPGGIPSHDTFNRFYAMADTAALEKCFSEWVSASANVASGRVINIDGKCLRGSRKGDGNSFIHMVSAWCNSSNMVLGQQKVYDKSNEITAIPALLEILFIEGATITIDAMGCQKDIAEKIVAGKADYILAVKGNQGVLEDDLREAFTHGHIADTYTSKAELNHGRIETRTTHVIKDLDWICKLQDWKKLYCIIMVCCKRIDKKSGKEELSERFYISSKKATAQQFNDYIRSHWGIENKLHWCLDVAFHEDMSKKRTGESAQNFSLITKSVLNLMKNHQKDKKDSGGTKISIKRKRLIAAWDNDYLADILTGTQ